MAVAWNVPVGAMLSIMKKPAVVLSDKPDPEPDSGYRDRRPRARYPEQARYRVSNAGSVCGRGQRDKLVRENRNPEQTRANDHFRISDRPGLSR
jgi:hypothetical protein